MAEGEQQAQPRPYYWPEGQAYSANGQDRIDRYVRATPASEIVTARPRWLWTSPPLRIPLGKVTIVGGREATAKSLFTLWLAACCTWGTLHGDLEGVPRDVIICAHEDDWADTIVPRFEVAARERWCKEHIWHVEVVDRWQGKESASELLVPSHGEDLEAMIIAHNVSLVIFDPIVSAMGGDLSPNKVSDVRKVLGPLVAIAARTRCAIVIIMHFSKMEGRDASTLLSGSHAWKDVARSAMVCAWDEDNAGVITQTKLSGGRKNGISATYGVWEQPYEFADGSVDQMPYFQFTGTTDMSVEELLDTRAHDKVNEARRFLRGLLTGGVWVPVKDMEAMAKAEGISMAALPRARKLLKARPEKGRGDDTRWYIHL